MTTNRKHSSDSALSEQEVIRRTEKIAQSLAQSLTQSFGLDEQNARAYEAFSGEIRALEKRLKDYHFEYVKLKRKVNLLEAELKDLDECVDRKTVVNLIHETVPLLIGKKGKGSSKSSSSESSSSDSDIDEIVKMIKHQRIRNQIWERQAQRKDQKKNAYNENSSESASNDSAGLSRLTRLRREMRNLGVSEKIISATLIPEITQSVKERLDLYDISNTPKIEALADVTIMLCIRPAEIKTLRIFNGGVTGYAKNRGQQDIPRRSRGARSQMVQYIPEKDRFLPETGKPLLPRYLRKLGAVFAVVSHGAKNLSEAMTIASQALRHSPENHASPAKNYTIVNYRKKGQPYNQAKAIKIFDEN
ncbi:hypothetical protein RhiirC2_795417 [Rhizophagus irregularis]|uniref:Uncharacterized protein n=1 Tax=Rhizophagus irregularis TaxID=588596 RepID=A0A2N1MBL0_9GLOM|nr:hypothetical protein RhiirC2_795417 [Rhizophagus irregularis]